MKRLRARLSALGDLSFNSDEFNGEAATGADVVSACNTVPFASPLRLVAVRNAGKAQEARRRGPGRLPGIAEPHHGAGAGGREARQEHPAVQGRREARQVGRHRLRAAQTLRAAEDGALHGRGPWRHAHGRCGGQDRRAGGRGHRAPRQRGQKDRARAPWRRPGERARDRRPRQPDGRSEAMGVRGCVLGARLAEMPALSGADEVDVAPCPHRQVHESPARDRLRAGAVRPRRARGHRGHAQNARLAMQEPCALGPRVHGGGSCAGPWWARATRSAP